MAPAVPHATAVAVQECGVLIVGAPGSGKSDLALRLIDRGAVLIADDRVELHTQGDHLRLEAPPAIAGLIEVRGLGLVRMPWRSGVRAGLVVDLEQLPERLPEPRTRLVAGVALPLLACRPFDASAPLRVELAVSALGRPGLENAP